YRARLRVLESLDISSWTSPLKAPVPVPGAFFYSRSQLLERDGRARVLLSRPPHGNTLNQGVLEERGVSRTPLPRSFIGGGVRHSRRQLLANADIAASRVAA